LTAHDWPGNARQLENEVKRLVASVRTRVITEAHLALPAARKPDQSQPGAGLQTGQTLFDALQTLERKMIEEALSQAAGNKHKASQRLGLSRQGLIKKLKRLGMTAAVD
jgi:DNA-binding NtrC family response regulator